KLLLHFINFGIIILSALSFSCSASLPTIKEEKEIRAASVPDWVRSGTDVAYPADRYLVGRGLAQASGDIVKDQDLADHRAFSQIASQIIASIKSEISVGEIEILTDKLSKMQGTTSANIAITSSIVVSGLKIVDRFYDSQERVYYSLAVLDREVAGAPFRARLIELRNQYENSLRLSRQFKNQGKILRSLTELKQAFESVHLFNDILPYYRLFQPTPDSYSDNFQTLPASDITSLASEILANLSIVKLRGDNQQGIPGRPLPIPLQVKVVLRDSVEIPAEGLTTLFRFTTGNGTIAEKAITDRDGIASSNVEVLQRSETGLYSIKAALDFSELMDTAAAFTPWNKLVALSTSSTVFSVRLKKAPPLKVLLIVDEDDGSGSISLNTLSNELTKAGLSPLTERDISGLNAQRVRKLLNQSDFERMRSEFFSMFSIIIMGEFHTALLNPVEGIQICTVTGSVKAISIDHNNVIAEEAFTNIKGFGNNAEQAKINALQNAGQRVAESLLSQILSIY
ncbi:MAG: LPP20 family lipoprotein, partial [Candidatus Kryptoniota bacterium]